MSVREEVESCVYDHRFFVTKLLESLQNASLPPSSITAARLATVNDTFNNVLSKERDLVASVKKLAKHQIAQQELQRIENETKEKRDRIIKYATQLRQSQEDIGAVLKKHRRTLDHAKQRDSSVLDPRDIVAYAHKIAGTTSAPKEWRPGFPMFGFMPPAPQEQMMRAGVLSRGVVDETVTHAPQVSAQYSATATGTSEPTTEEGSTNVPLGLGANEEEIKKRLPPGWKPGDPVDLPLDALLHYMGRSFFTEHGITLPEGWKPGDSIPPEAMDILREKFKLPAKREPLYDDEVVEDGGAKKKRKLENGSASADESGSDSDSDSSESSESGQETTNKISLSLSDDDDSDEDSS